MNVEPKPPTLAGLATVYWLTSLAGPATSCESLFASIFLTILPIYGECPIVSRVSLKARVALVNEGLMLTAAYKLHGG